MRENAEPDEEHLALLREGVETWNRWRDANRDVLPMLNVADLYGADLRGADLSRAMLELVNLSRADLSGASLQGSFLFAADLDGADLSRANLFRADLVRADLRGAILSGADLSRANLFRAILSGADLSRADLSGANLSGANLSEANLSEAFLTGADLSGADLSGADLSGADLSGAGLFRAQLVETTVERASLSGVHVYGVAAWNVKGEPKDQNDLVITPEGEPAVTVDDLKVAQFIYLMLSNEDIRRVIDTIGAKGVLILGRFGERKHVLDKLRDGLRALGWVPMVFDFEKPTSKDFTETVRTLAGMSAFIIADITAPKSVPQEAQAVVPDYMVPFVPIIQEGEEPWAMFRDLWAKHDWVFKPRKYRSIEDLLPRLVSTVVGPALEKRKDLLVRRASEMETIPVEDFPLDET